LADGIEHRLHERRWGHRPQRRVRDGLNVAQPSRLGFRLELSTLGDVTHDRDHSQASVGAQRAETDLDRELQTVAAPPEQFDLDAHRTRMRVSGVFPPMGPMTCPEAIRDESVDRHPHQLRRRIAEELLGTMVGQLNQPRLVDDEDPVRR
jgi:hypothetical protein